MADVKISALPAATTVAATDVAPMVVGSATQKATAAQIVTGALNATPVTVAQGGTGATTAAAARTALGLGSMATVNSPAPVANGGTGAATLTGIVKGNGAAAMTAATGADIVAAIGATAVQNATNATTAASCTGNAATATVAASCSGNAATATTAANGGVTQIIAGTNVTIDPAGGTGAVTINASGGGGSAAQTSTVTWNYGGTPVNLFEIAIPSWANSAIVNYVGLSMGQNNPGATCCLKVGGSVLTTGYIGAYASGGADAQFTNCFITSNTGVAAAAIYGQHLVDQFASNQWMTQGQHWRTSEALYLVQSCYVQTASMPTALVFQAGGTGTFDGGQVIVQFSSANNSTTPVLTGTTEAVSPFRTLLGNGAGGSGTGTGLTAIGSGAGAASTSGNYNTYFGYLAGSANLIGAGNTNIGYQAGKLATGGGNTLLGYNSGASVATGSNNTLVGTWTGSAALAGVVALSDGSGTLRQYFNNSGALSFDGTAFGTANHILKSSGTGAAPTWGLANKVPTLNVSTDSTFSATQIFSTIFASAASGTITITLPPASGNAGITYTIKRIDSAGANSVNIASLGGLIEGGSSSNIGVLVAVTYCSDGTNWWELANG